MKGDNIERTCLVKKGQKWKTVAAEVCLDALEVVFLLDHGALAGQVAPTTHASRRRHGAERPRRRVLEAERVGPLELVLRRGVVLRTDELRLADHLADAEVQPLDARAQVALQR